MAKILSDKELRSLFGTVLKNTDDSCLRPNSYVLRLGAYGEFLNTEKEFDLGKIKKGIKIHPGHSVGVTAHEELDFRRDTVHQIFPDKDLHAFVSPTTDLSREGIIAPTTQVDAGFHGTLNWTFTNNSSEERSFLFKERIYRITIWLLEEGERPEHLYTGDYQSQIGYVRSKRSGPPVGMKTSEWEVPFVKGGPQDLLDQLISSGYPWGMFGKKLKAIDEQFKDVTNEYSEIHDSIENLNRAVGKIRERQSETQNTVRTVLREEVGSLQNRWLIGAGSLLLGTIGLVLTASTSTVVWCFLKEYGAVVGIVFFVLAAVGLTIVGRKK
jgi:deoxycytidine triphosphate deaminase